jgi:hypothetical protein
MFRSSFQDGATEWVIVTGAPEYVLGPVTVSEHVHVIYLISPAGEGESYLKLAQSNAD